MTAPRRIAALGSSYAAGPGIPPVVDRAAMRSGDHTALRREIDSALGTAWDLELDPFRHAGEGHPTRWLYRVS